MQPGDPSVNALGVDVSEFQGQPDWPRVRQAGRQFAIVRASYGANHPDASFGYNWPVLKLALMHRGAYHFAVVGETTADLLADAQHQAAVFLAILDKAGGMQGGDLPPVLDLEQASNPHGYSPTEVVAWSAHWLACVDAAVKNPEQRALLYSDEAFLAWLAPAIQPLSDRGLWVASYNPDSFPADVAGWTHWTCWQYGDTGRVPGIAGVVDLDEWHTALPILVPPGPTVAQLQRQIASLEGELATWQDKARSLASQVQALSAKIAAAQQALQ
jgi:lysozyme